MKTTSIISILFLLSSFTLQAQTIFDRFENYLKDRHFQLSYGPQLTWYKTSNIDFIQEKYDRDIRLLYAQATDDKDDLRHLFTGQYGVTQFRINVGIDLSEKYSFCLNFLHLTYKVRVDRAYYRLGTWNGQSVLETVRLDQDFKKLEHSNGINISNIGIRRNIALRFLDFKRSRFYLGLMPNLGLVFTATQAEILNPDGVFEHYDLGNFIAGFNFAGEGSFRWTIREHWDIVFNYNYFQMLIWKAKLEEDAYVKQNVCLNWNNSPKSS